MKLALAIVIFPALVALPIIYLLMLVAKGIHEMYCYRREIKRRINISKHSFNNRLN